MYYTTKYTSPIGNLSLVSNETALIGVWMEGQKYSGGSLRENLVENETDRILEESKIWLDSYFSGSKPSITDLPLAPMGGEFRQRVWKILCEIPYGKVITYGQISMLVAKQLNKTSMSSQAVGGAVGHNPISIIIPCHRVVGSNGSLTGYAGGIQRKIALLEHEGLDMSKFTLPKKDTVL